MELVRGSIQRDGRRVAIHPADVRGRFARARNVVFFVLIAIYVALPWIPIGGHPAVFLDVNARRFYLFGATFNAQDVWMMVVLGVGTGFALITATALLGRVWCGYGCPQTVFMESLYRPVERFLLGPREKRIRGGRPVRATLAHIAYALISLALAHVLLAYFVSLPRLYGMMTQSPAAHPEAFALVMVVSFLLYVNFAWFREQLCVVLCPYGRLQSVLVDEDSLIIGYDALRGEPRGKAKQPGAGDCVDCKRCVVVCPTGIDIRDGLQMDCIACTACVDACDEVMVKLKRPTGLVRYDSQRGLRGEKRRIVRPRLIGYAAVITVFAAVASFTLSKRRDFEANLLRPVGSPFVVADGQVRNSFNVHLVNKRPERATFVVEAEHDDGVSVTLPMARLELESLADRSVPIVVAVERARWRPGMEVEIKIGVEGEDDHREIKARILGPVGATQ
jgi:cytochrome c oxidase accessory protein FixG